MAWHFTADTPVWVQIAGRIRNEIISGVYATGEQIPPVRQLALSAAVNPNTVQRAFASLESEGLLCVKGTLGRFVTEDESVIAAAKKTAARELVNSFLTRAAELSISTDELISMLREAEK